MYGEQSFFVPVIMVTFSYLPSIHYYYLLKLSGPLYLSKARKMHILQQNCHSRTPCQPLNQKGPASNYLGVDRYLRIEKERDEKMVNKEDMRVHRCLGKSVDYKEADAEPLSEQARVKCRKVITRDDGGH